MTRRSRDRQAMRRRTRRWYASRFGASRDSLTRSSAGAQRACRRHARCQVDEALERRTLSAIPPALDVHQSALAQAADRATHGFELRRRRSVVNLGSETVCAHPVGICAHNLQDRSLHVADAPAHKCCAVGCSWDCTTLIRRKCCVFGRLWESATFTSANVLCLRRVEEREGSRGCERSEHAIGEANSTERV